MMHFCVLHELLFSLFHMQPQRNSLSRSGQEEIYAGRIHSPALARERSEMQAQRGG